MSHVDPIALIVWLAIISAFFVFMVIRCRQCLKFLRSYKQDLSERVQALRIHRMLGRLGIKTPRYLRKARAIDVETQLIRCSGCETTDVCDAYLQSDEIIDPHTFCLNYSQLKTYGPFRKKFMGNIN